MDSSRPMGKLCPLCNEVMVDFGEYWKCRNCGRIVPKDKDEND